MYFITNEPKLFNVETGNIVAIYDNPYHDDYRKEPESHEIVMNAKDRLFKGSRQECEDFIYALAGWVGAVNPMSDNKPVIPEEYRNIITKG